MAFNLNKNDGAEKGSSNKTSSSSGFNLSKQSVQAQPVQSSTKRSSGSKTWIIGLIGVIVLGAGAWYFSSHKESASVNQSTTSDSVIPASTEVVDTIINTTPNTIAITEKPTDKIDAQQNRSDSKASVVAALDRKIPVTFAQGSSSFMSIDQSLIKRMISYLKDNSETSINVNGYASSDGSLEVNQTISQARADAFKKFLVSKNIAKNRITALGKGIENPIASNESSLGRKRNRRIEITFP